MKIPSPVARSDESHCFRVVAHHENVAGWNPAAPRRRVFGKRHRPLHHQRQCGFHDTRSGIAKGRRG